MAWSLTSMPVTAKPRSCIRSDSRPSPHPTSRSVGWPPAVCRARHSSRNRSRSGVASFVGMHAGAKRRQSARASRALKGQPSIPTVDSEPELILFAPTPTPTSSRRIARFERPAGCRSVSPPRSSFGLVSGVRGLPGLTRQWHAGRPRALTSPCGAFRGRSHAPDSLDFVTADHHYFHEAPRPSPTDGSAGRFPRRSG